jgi:diguanylate cyclase (GGDEF)-like protein
LLLVARLPYEVIQLPIEAIGQRFFVAAGFLLLFFLVFAGVVLRRLFRPLTQSAKQLRQMASGHEPLRALPVVYPDEVGELAGGFNKLLSQLEANMQALRESEASMALLARHDALTGLPNRSVLEERLQQTGEQASRLESHASLLFLDLDGFKAVNDQHGHKVGDSLLREVAQRLQAHRRKLDLVVRLGGDEFVILLQNKGHNPAAVHLVAQQCIDDMGRPFQVEGLTLALGVSIGIAHQQQGQKADLLLLQADMAMYAAKNAGRNQFCEYHPDMKAPGTAPPTPDIQSH